MTPYTDIQGEIRQYLLGTLSEDARRRVEERLMTEEAFLEELTMAEGALIDDYVGERLTAAERSEFGQHFLSTEERRRQLRFTQALGRYADAAAGKVAGAREPARPAPTMGERLRGFWGGLSWGPRAGLALACVAVIVGALWLARPVAPPTPHTFVALTLASDSGDRSGGPDVPEVPLPLGADALKLTLTLPAGTVPAASYRAEMLTGVGRTEVVEVAGRDERTVTVVVPEARLARGQYAIQLYADNTERRVGSYLFNVK